MLFVAEGPQRKEQVLVAAVAGHDLIRLQPEVGRCCPQQVGTGGVGVKAELFHFGFTHRRHHRRGRQIRAFVGVQFDVLLVLRLFARRIGGDSGQGGGKKTAHEQYPPVFFYRQAASPSPPRLTPCHLAPRFVAYATSLPSWGESVRGRGKSRTVTFLALPLGELSPKVTERASLFHFSYRMVTLFAWACRPSRSAKSAMRGATSPSASRV